jgi:hypothetical protein
MLPRQPAPPPMSDRTECRLAGRPGSEAPAATRHLHVYLARLCNASWAQDGHQKITSQSKFILIASKVREYLRFEINFGRPLIAEAFPLRRVPAGRFTRATRLRRLRHTLHRIRRGMSRSGARQPSEPQFGPVLASVCAPAPAAGQHTHPASRNCSARLDLANNLGDRSDRIIG